MRPSRPVSATASRSGLSMPISFDVSARRRSSSVTILSRASERTRDISATSTSGLVRKSSAPASRPFTRSEGWSSAVTITTGIWWVAGLDLSLRQTSKPSISGIITSSSTMSHSARSHIASAWTPLLAVMTSKYSADNRASSSFTLAGTSSTTRTRAVMIAPSGRPQEMPDGLDELADRNRLRQIGFATALANAFLVALHGKGGDRHDRYRLEFGIVLEPFCHFEAGYFRQLDIHQNEIRPVLACEIKRFDPIAGADGRIAVRFEKIVEELHIQLVVLHNQDGFRHLSPPHLSPVTRPARRARRRQAMRARA